MSKENNMAEGVVFRSASSGLYYQNIDAAGDVDAVRVNGVVFEKKENDNKGMHYCDQHGGYGFVRDCKTCNARS